MRRTLEFRCIQLDSKYFSFQWVCGVLRLADDDSSGEEVAQDLNNNNKGFDAWPSEECKEKISHAKRLHQKYCEICEFRGELGYGWWEYDTDESSVLHFDDSSSGGFGESAGEEDEE